MEKINTTDLLSWQEHYQLIKENNLVQKALVKNEIDTVAINGNRYKDLAPHFTISLDTLPVTNQMKSGRCWIFAGCNIIRQKIAKLYNLENFELSQSYLAFYDKLEKANFLMETLLQLSDSPEDERTRYFKLTTGVEDGGQWDMFVHLVKKYGLVPKEVMPETYQSSHTNQLNRIINTKIRQFAAFVQEKKANLSALKKKALEDIYKILVDCYGMPPTKFSFEYTDKNNKYHCIEDITPLDFYEQYSDIDLDEYISIIHAPTVDKPYHHLFNVKWLGNVIEAPGVRYLNLPLTEFKKIIVQQLRALEPVWFGSDCNQGFSRADGIWDPLLLDYETTFQVDLEMDKAERLNTFESTMNHAMVLVGVNLEQEKIHKWKIENSWGKDKGKDGYYVASDEWFDNFVYQAVVKKKYLTVEQQQILNQEPIVLPPWDPFGTLAS